MDRSRVGVVVIGRNEGERLGRCLRSLVGLDASVYVDSGSTDGSRDLARTRGFDVVELDTSAGFTAARARNAGVERLDTTNPELEFVQFVDGDCEVREGWIETALADFRDDVAVVFGRRREREPDRNAFHRACDVEWQVPAGEVSSCGGDALFRLEALRQVGGYNPAMIAGEEPELCLRLRTQGWKILSNTKEMTWHDVAIDRFGQWWRRAKRTGFGFTALVDLHGPAADPSWRRLLASARAWSAIAAVAALALIVFVVVRSPWAGLLAGLLILMLFAGILRTAWRARSKFATLGQAVEWSGLLYIAKLAQTQGWLSQRLGRRRAEPARIIEYK